MDPDFAAAAAACLAELTEAADAELEGELENRLRPRYPKIAVHRMEVIAKEWTPAEVWYVYRDGHLRVNRITERTTELSRLPRRRREVHPDAAVIGPG